MKHAATAAMILVSALSAIGQEEAATNLVEETPAPASPGLQLEGRTEAERTELLLEIGDVYFSEQDYDAAMRAYQRILEYDKENKDARFKVSSTYIGSKQYEKAKELIEVLLKEFPEEYQLMNNLAWIYASADDLSFRNAKRAIELAQEAMVLAPNDYHIWSTLSESYYVSGQYEKAYRAINQMKRLVMKSGGQNVTQAMVNSYNEQIMKCKRAWESEKVLKGIESSEEP